MNPLPFFPRPSASPARHPDWSVLGHAPQRAKPAELHVPHGNLRVLVGWGPHVGKTVRLLELAQERAHYTRVAVVCAPDRVAWVQTQVPRASVFGAEHRRIDSRRVEASGAEEVFVDDVERLDPGTSWQLTSLASGRSDVTVALNAQHLLSPEPFWEQWFDRCPLPVAPLLPNVLVESAHDLE